MADQMSDEPLRDRIAKKLAEWAFQAAETKGVKLTSFHRYTIEQEAPARADMVMEVVRPELERLRAELAAFVPPGALSAGETPALCGTCTELLCVPGLPGCARCVKAELDRLAEQAKRVPGLVITSGCVDCPVCDGSGGTEVDR